MVRSFALMVGLLAAGKHVQDLSTKAVHNLLGLKFGLRVQ